MIHLTPSMILAIVLVAVSCGSLAGYAAGRAVERTIRTRRRVGAPE